MQELQIGGTRLKSSEIPLLRFRNQEVAEDLNARNGFEFFRVHEEGVEGEIVKIAEQLHQAAVLLDQIVRKHRDAEPALTGAQQTEHVVDRQPRLTRSLAVAACVDEPAR